MIIGVILSGGIMEEPRLNIRQRRRLPHWTLSGSTYYVTFHLVTNELNSLERRIVVDHITSGHGRYYNLAALTVMPDHVHIIFKPLNDFTLQSIMKGIKGVSARLINQYRKTKGNVWQEESFDRIIRDVDEFEEKLQYMFNNPVKAGLVTDPNSYDGWCFNSDFV
jgi:putative transposase